jgi:F0F1-type ATP synthase membrane subunit b/b'
MEVLTYLVELIPSVGFPIVCVIAMGIFIFKIYKASETREAKLMVEITENRKINEQAIETIAKYAESLESMKTDISEIKTDITVITAKIQ